MKTLLFTLEYPPFYGGVANYYGNLAKFWPIGQNIDVLDRSQEKLNFGRGFLSWWPSVILLDQKLSRTKYDYLLVGQILPLGTASFIVSLFRPIKYVVFLHGMDFALALRSRRKRWLSKLILGRAHKIICANSYVHNKLLEFKPQARAKSSIINPGIEGRTPRVDETEIIRLKQKHKLEGKTILLSLGRLVKRKGVDRTLEALKQVNTRTTKDWHYFIAGIGPREEYLKNLVPIELIDKVTFLGEVSEEEKWQWLKLSDIFIMPSRDIAGDFEGFGIVYLEANLSGKPVVAGNSGGVRDAVIHEETGLLVNPDDINSISEAIIRLLDDSNLRELLGTQGRTRAINDFSWENLAAKACQFIIQ